MAAPTSCADLGDAAAQLAGCCLPDNKAAYCDGGQLVTSDCAVWNTTCGQVPQWNMNYCAPTGVTARCGDVPAPHSTGQVLHFRTVTNTWWMACYDAADSTVFIYIEDLNEDKTALRFQLKLGGPQPWQGRTVDLGSYSKIALPFFLETLNDIMFDSGGSYDGEFLGYRGTVEFQQLTDVNPIGTPFRIRIRNYWGREIGRDAAMMCTELPNGRRMNVDDTIVEGQINDLHVDSDCRMWAGG
jgi:hypothetical protein